MQILVLKDVSRGSPYKIAAIKDVACQIVASLLNENPAIIIDLIEPVAFSLPKIEKATPYTRGMKRGKQMSRAHTCLSRGI